jgi:hypothetical protein
MLVRFVTTEIDECSQVAAGIFCAAYRLRDRDDLPYYEHEVLLDVLRWFDLYLERPWRFSRTLRPRLRIAICWFRPSATEHIRKTWEMASVLENNDVPIRMLKTDCPGYIVYEDDYQVVAEPYGKTRVYLR